ncbi:transglycosylase family protein [Pseudonocardia sp. WMMC193]|uniref:transglycosylase family protein n=2 Tax=Pseudonocardia sp. WMMC193 TaxID=2911965 RepID=UPI0027E13D7B|nr:transglycosylase family protein [Pseudonocardia sp. WMMC193]
MSTPRRAGTVLLIAAALTAGPAAGAAWAEPTLTDGATCTQSTKSGSGVQTADPTGPDGSLDPQVLAQAQELVAQTRALLTTLISSDDPRAAALAEQLRGMGVTPAVASGWRQQAHDVADSLLAQQSPVAQEAAVVLASAGFSPTPADLRGPSDAQAVVERDSPSHAAVSNASLPAMAATAPVSGTQAGATPMSAMSAVLAGATEAAASQSGDGPVQVCGQGPVQGARGSLEDDEASQSEDRDGSSNGGTSADLPDDRAPTGGPSSETTEAGSSVGTSPSASSASGEATDGTASQEEGDDSASGGRSTSASDEAWSKDLQALTDELSARVDDPDAQALAQRLRGSGLDESAEPSSADSDPASTTSGAGAASSGTSSAPRSLSPGRSTGPASSAVPGGASGDLDVEIGQLANELAAAPDDPVAQQLSQALGSAGFAGSEPGGAADRDGGSGSSGSTGSATSSSPGGGVSKPQNDPSSDSSSSLRTGEGGGGGSGEAKSAAASPSSASTGGREAEPTSSETDPESSPSADASPQDSSERESDGVPQATPSGNDETAPDQAPTATTDGAVWEQLAKCESNGNWAINSGNGYSGVIRTAEVGSDADHCGPGEPAALPSSWWASLSALASWWSR